MGKYDDDDGGGVLAFRGDQKKCCNSVGKVAWQRPEDHAFNPYSLGSGI